MKNKLLFVSMLFLFYHPLFPWGEEGHKLITKKAVENLPDELKGIKKFEEILVNKSNDADKRREFDSSENPKHYIDLDFYREFRQGSMIREKAELVKIYGSGTVIKTGILPWATLVIYENLVKNFKRKNTDSIIIYISDLAHYVEDGHQPMHTIINYDGQLSGQTGIHHRYESEMINMNLDELSNSFNSCTAKSLTNPEAFIFEYLTEANSFSDLLFSADDFAYKECGSRESEDYYRLLWFKTKYITGIQFGKAAADLNSLIYSAWVEAGKPSFEKIK